MESNKLGNDTILQLLRDKTPGTFDHSRNVATMVKTLAEQLDLPTINDLELAALYHDIGKTIAPQMFTENQADENPHDNLPSNISCRYISAHVGDTAQLLLSYPEVPRQVIEWCVQHHGTSIMSFFYKKDGCPEDDTPYRYQCSKPASLEAALLMICDRIEATSRSLMQSGKLDGTGCSDLVNSIIDDLIEDGQLDNVTLKLGQLRLIRIALAEEVKVRAHKRINYDKKEEV